MHKHDLYIRLFVFSVGWYDAGQHDLWAYRSGSYYEHAHLGAEYARKVAGGVGYSRGNGDNLLGYLFHDSKTEVGAPMDEILKDADVIDHSLTDPTKEIKAHERERFAKLCEELGLSK